MEDAGGWAGWILSASPTNDIPPLSIALAIVLSHFVYDDPEWDVRQFDVSKILLLPKIRIVLGHTLAPSPIQ